MEANKDIPLKVERIVAFGILYSYLGVFCFIIRTIRLVAILLLINFCYNHYH